MFSEFGIEHFRGFKNFKIEGLKQVTLVGGKNNVGKTSLLESLFIHCGQTNLELLVRTNSWRGLLPLMPLNVNSVNTVRYFLHPSFYDGDLAIPIRFKSISDNGISRLSEITAQTSQIKVETLLPVEKTPGKIGPEGIQLTLCKVTYNEDGAEPLEHNLVLSIRGQEVILNVVPPHKTLPFATHFLHEGLKPNSTEDASIYSSLRELGKEKLVLEGLRAIDPRIESLEVLSPGGAPSLYANMRSGKRIQVSLLGQGCARLAHILLITIQAAEGVILIDEVAYGLHYSVLPEVWKVISEAAKQYNVQIFATTHSFEVISAAHKAFLDMKAYQLFGYYRLEAIDDMIQVIHVDQQSLSLAIDAGFEIR